MIFRSARQVTRAATMAIETTPTTAPTLAFERVAAMLFCATISAPESLGLKLVMMVTRWIKMPVVTVVSSLAAAMVCSASTSV